MIIWASNDAINQSSVYACADKERNPIEIQIQCKQLTRYQWWGAYYEGKK
jgi:hypothetical protein